MSDDQKRDRALQRRVRERQAKTGESYQAAWRQLTGTEAPIGPVEEDDSADADSTGSTEVPELIAEQLPKLLKINSQMFEGTVRVLGQQNANLHEQNNVLVAENAALRKKLEAPYVQHGPHRTEEVLSRAVIPIQGPPVFPNQTARVTVRAEGAVDVTQLRISAAGTKNGAADWVINDIEIDGRSQLAVKDLSGAFFGSHSLIAANPRAYTSIELKNLDTVEHDHELTIVVTYVGSNPNGAPFFAAAIGTQAPQRPTVLPIESAVPLLPTVRMTIAARALSEPFLPRRLEISDDHTTGGAADWIVNDLRINGKTQFNLSGDIPGDLFAVSAIDSFITLETCDAGNAIEIDMTYIGLNVQGVIFSARVEGTVVREDYSTPPSDLHVVVETSGQGPGSPVVGTCRWRPPHKVTRLAE